MSFFSKIFAIIKGLSTEVLKAIAFFGFMLTLLIGLFLSSYYLDPFGTQQRNRSPNDNGTITDPNGDNNNDDGVINGDPDPINDPILATEILNYFKNTRGNTNGNINNAGIAVYDYALDVHYIGSGNNIYQFDPNTKQLSVLNTMPSGRASYLNYLDNALYYINTNDEFLYQFKISDRTTNVLFEEIHHRAQITPNHFHIIADGTWGPTWYRYNLSTNVPHSLVSYVTSISFYFTRAYMVMSSTPLSIDLRDAGSAQGRVTVVNFGRDFEVTELHETFVIRHNQNYQASFALIASKGNTKGVYIYHQEEAELIELMTGNVNNVNYDGTYLYFTEGASLYRVLFDDPADIEYIMTLTENIEDLVIINHWIYYRVANASVITQVNPVTHQKRPIE